MHLQAKISWLGTVADVKLELITRVDAWRYNIKGTGAEGTDFIFWKMLGMLVAVKVAGSSFIMPQSCKAKAGILLICAQTVMLLRGGIGCGACSNYILGTSCEIGPPHEHNLPWHLCGDSHVSLTNPHSLSRCLSRRCLKDMLEGLRSDSRALHT